MVFEVPPAILLVEADSAAPPPFDPQALARAVSLRRAPPDGSALALAVADDLAVIVTRGVAPAFLCALRRAAAHVPILVDDAAALAPELGGVLVFPDGGTDALLAHARFFAERRRDSVGASRADGAQPDLKFRATFEQGVHFAAVLSPEGLVVDANRASVESSGFTRDEVIGKPFWQRGWWSRSPALVDMAHAACETARAGATFREESTSFLAEGGFRVLDLCVSPVTDDAGNVQFLVATGGDITARKRREDELAERELRYRLVADAANDTVWDWNVVTDQRVWNDGLRTNFGYTAEGVRADGAWWAERVHPEDLPAIRANLEAHLDGGPCAWSAEYRFRRGDGAYAYVAERGRVVRDAETGRALRMVASITDSTERREAEAALRDSEERFAFVRRSSGVGFWYCDLPFDVLQWDDQVKAHFHLSPTARVAIDLFYELLHPDDREPTRQAIARSIEERTTYDVVYRTVAPDTGAVRWVQAIGRTVHAADGTPKRFDGITIDVTDRRVAEANLRASEERFRFLDALGEATSAAADPAAIMATTARLLGEHLSVTRTAYADVDADGDRFSIRHDWTAAGAQSTVGVYSLDTFGPRAASDMRAGRTLVVRDVARELTDAEGGRTFAEIGIQAIVCCPLVKSGRLVAMMAVHHATPRDWSAAEIALMEEVVERSWAHIERGRLVLQLVDADRRKDEFLAMLGHELRNPLAPIRNALAILERHGPHDAAAARLHMTIGRQVDHLTRLVDDLLDVARITSGKVTLKRERVLLATLITQAVDASRPILDGKRHTLEVDVAREPIWLEADAVRLAQIVSNLLHNAAKYTDEGGRVRLAAAREGTDVVVRVADNGIGLAPEMVPRVFDLFTQVSPDLARSAGGLGVGLTVARRLAEMHGGRVEAASPGVGKGSEFVLRIPAAASAAPASREVATAPPARVGKRVLVVDDNADSLETMAMLLELYGHVVSTAADGIEAVDVARAVRPEVVLLDLGLPGRDGYEVARLLRASQEGALRIIAVTGYGQEGDRRRTREAGFDVHLVKPVDVTALEVAIAGGP